jgi:preprotein translocase subunit YajC
MLPQLQQVASLLAAQTAEQAGDASGPRLDLLLPLIMMAVLYFVWIRPASKERKQHQTMLEALKRGDEVVTTSGLLGQVADISERVITLEVAKNVKVRLLRSAIARKVEPAKDKAEEKAPEKS